MSDISRWRDSGHLEQAVQTAGGQEEFNSAVASLAGLDAAEVRLETFGDRPVLVITRFDRELKGGRLVRRHQEDGCQALGTNPSGPAKYQVSDGVVCYQRLAAVLAAHASDQTDQFRRLFYLVTSLGSQAGTLEPVESRLPTR